MTRRILLLLSLILVVTCAQACGPDFFPDVFVRTSRPDLPQRYVTGHLGILQPSFPSADLFVAFRYLSGGTLSPAEQKSWSPTTSIAEQDYEQPSAQAPQQYADEPQASVKLWQDLRAQYPNPPSANLDANYDEKIATPQGDVFVSITPNCNADAFRTANATLQARTTTWGKTSAPLLSWLIAQDAVFAACSRTVPAPEPAPAGSPLLLQQDRAYQTAAAHLYGRQFDLAEQQFLAIAADHASPWAITAGYVAGRVLIRKSFFAVQNTQAPADFESSSMQVAARYFRAYLASNPSEPWRSAAQKQLALIRIRTDQDTRTRELAALLTGPGEDPNYAQDVRDVQWVLAARVLNDFRAEADTWETYKAQDGSTQMRRLTLAEAEQHAAAKRDEAYRKTAPLRSLAPIVDWAITLRTLSNDNAAHALAQWKQTHSAPWLVAALMLAPGNAAPDPTLLQATANVPASSPAWQTVTFHRARLQLAAGDPAAARTTLATLQAALDHLPPEQREPSSVNAVRGLAMQAAADRPALLSHLAQTLLLAASQTNFASNECAEATRTPKDWHHCIVPGKNELSPDAARLLNEQAPLSVWVAAAQDSSVPQPLRFAIAMQGFTRATLLRDTTAANSFAPLLPRPLQTELATGGALNPWLVLIRNPGLQPSVDPGVQRAYSYDFVESFRLNWCYNPEGYVTPPQKPAALTPAELAQGAAEAHKLHPVRAVDVGKQVITTVQTDPSNPAAPEALYLVLRMIRYGCNPVHEPGDTEDFSASDARPNLHTGEQLLQLRRDTAALMRRYYAASPWTKKAAPFVGEVHPPANK